MLERDFIRRYAIRGDSRTSDRWKREVRATASSVDLHPLGLSRSCLVFIRSLRVVSRTLRGSVWRTINDQVPESIARAERPARGFVPANASAVLFADQAELLSCLARDWTSGELSSRWWWRSLLGDRDLGEAAKREWLLAPRTAPAALAQLLSSEPSLSFLRFFHPEETDLLFTRILEAFGLIALSRPDDRGQRGPGDKGHIHVPTTAFRRLNSSYLPPAVAAAIDDATRPIAERRLIAVGLLLVHSPARVRSDSFAQEFRDWSAACDSVAKTFSFEAPTRGLSPSPSISNDGFLPRGNDRDGSASERNETGQTPGASPAFEYTTAGPDDGARQRADSTIEPADSTRASSPSLTDLNQDGAPIALPAGERMETLWGGVFYLVNVALALGYYGDFTSPRAAGLTLPLWDFLAIFGAQFIGPAFADDGLPDLLRRLSARREGEAPGDGFTPAGNLDFPTWRERTETQLRQRLLIALGGGADGLIALIFRQRASVCVTVDRVDITFFLSEHPIELRLAGLDRDPGWVPAGGRTLAFHYE